MKKEKKGNPPAGPGAKRAERLKAIENLIFAGSQLSNITYNLAQREELAASTRKVMDTVRKEWDAALITFRNLKKARAK